MEVASTHVGRRLLEEIARTGRAALRGETIYRRQDGSYGTTASYPNARWESAEKIVRWVLKVSE